MADQVFTMTTGHVVRWTGVNGFLVGFWTWFVLTEESGVMRTIGLILGLLALRGLAGSIVAFFRRPTLSLGPAALTVTDVVRAREVLWAECSEFRAIRNVINGSGYVRYQAGARRRSLPAGFGDAKGRLTASELADALNRAKDASSSGFDPASA